MVPARRALAGSLASGLIGQEELDAAAEEIEYGNSAGVIIYENA